MKNAVLVLNQNYEPLNVCNVRRALVLVLGGKAEVLQENGHVVATARMVYKVPSVIRLAYYIKRPRPRVKLSRREVFMRDNHTCQYCGHRGGDLTIDHVIPRSRGGLHTWDNVVSACRPCNHRKGGKSVAEAHMQLRIQPFEPRAGTYYAIERRFDIALQEEWHEFLPGFETARTWPSHRSSSESSSIPA